MPTYDDLRAYFQESTPLQNIARTAAIVPIVRGFTLTVDPLCMELPSALVQKTRRAFP